MTDRIRDAFLERQREEGMALSEASDLLTLVPIAGDPPYRYLAEFRCIGLVKTAEGAIEECDRSVVGIWFPDDYLRTADPFLVLQWLAPANAHHPNVSDRAPFVCLGRMQGGTPLVDILYRLFELISYARVTVREDDALNRAACAWARRNLHRFPLDRRSLRRRSADFGVEELA